MVAKNLSKLIETSRASWKPSRIEGVQIMSLNTDPNDRQGTFLVKIAPGGRYPKHRHPGGEELYVLKGEATAGGYQLKAGDFLYSPPASVHDMSTKDGCVCLQILPKSLQIVPEGATEEIESLPDIVTSSSDQVSPDTEAYDPSLRTIDDETKE